jgi:hypothetical protein
MIGGTYSTHRKVRIYTKLQYENLKRREHTGHRGVDSDLEKGVPLGIGFRRLGTDIGAVLF